MKRVDLVLKVGSSVLAEEHGALDLLAGRLAELDRKAELAQVGSKCAEDPIALQAVLQRMRADRALMRSKDRHDWLGEGRWWLCARERRKPNAGSHRTRLASNDVAASMCGRD